MLLAAPAQNAPVPLPKLRPDHLIPAPQPPATLAPPTTAKPAPIAPAAPPILANPDTVPSSPHPMPDNTLTGEACFAGLQKLGAKFDRPAEPVGAGPCSVADPVKISAVATAKVSIRLPDTPLLTCGFAMKFTTWLTEQAEPIILAQLQDHIATLGTGPGYQCRGRNGDITAKLSEHAFGNAVDIEHVHLVNGENIEISSAIDPASKYQPVLAALRAAGCRYFTTVLGPGANPAHASHFHFDLERRGKNGDNRLCE